jgi:hypothetical protein
MNLRFVSACASVLALAVILLCVPANGQVLYGSLVGTVSDPSGSVVPRATVRVSHEETGQTRTTETNESGGFVVPSLIPGHYTVEVSAAGFGVSRRTGVEVTINTVSRVDVNLQLTQVGESVQVAAHAVALQTDKADVHSEISSREATQLPISGYRNFQTLINLVPGATPAGYQNAVIGSPGRALGTNINGTTNNNSNTRLDGANNMRAALPHQIMYVPPIESIESVNVATNNFDADQGFAGGAAINISTKSGSNALHGVLFEHHSNSAFFAKNFFFQPNQRKPKNLINIFGGTLGGPIRRDKLFFFVSFEGMRERTNNSGLFTVPTEAQRRGDFSAFATPIYDPLTGVDGTGRTQFPRNIIPPDRLSSIAQRLQALLPAPNVPGAVAANYFASASAVFDRDNYDGKLNWNFSEKTTIWTKFSSMRGSVVSQPALGEAGGAGLINGGGTGTGYVLSQVGTVGAVHAFSPAVVIDGTFSYSHDPLDLLGHDYGQNLGLEYGIPGTNGPDPRQGGMPSFNVTGYSIFGQVDPWSPKLVDNSAIAGTTNMNWNHGTHELRFGYDTTYNDLNQWHPERGFGPRGGFTFNGGVTSLRGGPAPDQYNAYAQFLLGLTSTAGKSVQVYEATPKQWLHGLYLRDRWRAGRRVTISLGLRWEYFPLMTRGDRGIERYDWTTNLVTIGGLGNVPMNNGMTTSKTLFAPRLGVAWRITDRSVLRTGYGLSVDPYQMLAAETLLFPYPVVIAQDFSAANTFVPLGSLESGIPPVDVPDVSTGTLRLPPNVSTTTLEAGTYRRGYIQSFNFIFERELPGGFIGSAGYVGTRTVRQPVARDINAASTNGGNAGRPLFPAFARIATTTVLAPSASAAFDSLQARLDRTLPGGALVKIAYTFSKAINVTDNSAGGLLFHNAEVFARNRALAGYDRTHNLRMAFVSELPFGRGKPMLSDSAIGSALLGGWQLSGIFSAYSGTPFTVTAAGTSLNAPGNTQTADQVKPDVEKLGGVGPNARFFDPTAFASVTAPRYGTSGRNILRGPGTVNLDATLARNFMITERWQLQIRAEAYNVTNTPSFNNPNANASTPASFMTVTSARNRSGSIEGGERALRFGLRISF